MELLLKALATWRISHMLVYNDGPFDSIITFRHMMKVKHEAWSPLFCLWCTSVWVGTAVSVLPKIVCTPFALSGLAVFIEGLMEWLDLKQEQ